jgi:hypothetical protein
MMLFFLEPDMRHSQKRLRTCRSLLMIQIRIKVHIAFLANETDFWSGHRSKQSPREFPKNEECPDETIAL